MLVIDFFNNFFKGFGDVLAFLNTPFKLYLPSGLAIGEITGDYGVLLAVNVTPLTAFGVSCGAFLTIAFILHLWHLLKLVF